MGRRRHTAYESVFSLIFFSDIFPSHSEGSPPRFAPLRNRRATVAQRLRNVAHKKMRLNPSRAMNLQAAAEAEQDHRTHSKLEPHREAIFALRRKHWTYREIAQWLNERGVVVTFTSVYRFCERAIARRPRRPAPATAKILPPVESPSLPTPQPTTETKSESKKHRFNLDI